MYKNKKDVDRHVQDQLRKVKSEIERNIQCYNFAKLYASVGDHETAVRYVSSYLVIKPEVAGAHKLLAKSLEALGRKEKALEEYKAVLSIDPVQKEIILKVCELIVEVASCKDLGRARYWCERADEHYPHHPTVFRLKEHLLTAEGEEPDSHQLKKLITTEMAARPLDVSLHIRTLRLYMDTEQLAEAYQHASQVELRPAFWDLVEWYECLSEVYRAYHAAHVDQPSAAVLLTWEFYMGFVSVLDRAASLQLNEPAPRSLQQCTQAVFLLDQNLHLAAGRTAPASHRHHYQEFLAHQQGQLCFHLATLVLKKARKECNTWRDSCRVAAPLLLRALIAPPDRHAPWIAQLNEQRRKAAERWIMQASYRNSQAGNVVLGLVVDTRTQFKERCAQACAGNWRERVYQRLFTRQEHHAAITTSHFVNHNAFTRAAPELPTHAELREHNEVSQLCAPACLDLQVWLGLRAVESRAAALEFRSRGFDRLQLACSNTKQAGVEALCRMDVDAFLYATVFCVESARFEDDPSADDRPAVLPFPVSARPCSEEQRAWWTAAHDVQAEQRAERDPGEMRATLQRGLEVVRCLGNHGVDLKLVVRLAKAFAYRAQALVDGDEEVEALMARAALYWKVALVLIERTQRKQVIYAPQKRLFEYHGKELSASELCSLHDEARLFLALRLKAAGQLEAAVECLEQLTSPDATFHCAEIYVAMATAELERQPREEITSEMRSRNIVLLTRARDSLYLTEDRLRGANRRDHPLHAVIKEHLEDIESRLNRIDPDVCRNDGNRRAPSDESASSWHSGGVGSSVAPLLVTPRNVTNNRHNTSTPLRSGAHRHGDHADNSQRNDLSKYETMMANVQQQNLAIMESNRWLTDSVKSIMESNELVRDSVKTIMADLQGMKLAVDDLTAFKINVQREVNELRVARRNDLTSGADDLYVFDEDFVEDPAQINASPLGPPFNAAAYTDFRYHDMLLYPPPLPYYGHGALPFSEGQQLPDFRPAYVGPPANVVITTSDVLPTRPAPPQPAMSVVVPQRHRAGGAVPHNFQIDLPLESRNLEQASRLEKESAALSPVRPIPVDTLLSSVPDPLYSAVAADRSHDDDDSVEEHEPNVDFVPVIPLPAEVEVNTGEQEEEAIYTCRSKLFRFVDKEWKERGVGTLRLLRHPETKVVRLVMRRDQTHKICANLRITPDLELRAMGARAWFWVANDFADEQLRLEKLCAKFKTEDEAANFKDAFEAAVLSAPMEASSPAKPAADASPAVSATPPSLQASPATSAIVSPPKFQAGGFTFASTPSLKPTPVAVETPPPPVSKPGPFAGFTFTSTPTSAATWGALATKQDATSSPWSLLSTPPAAAPAPIPAEKPMFDSPAANLSFTSLPASEASFKTDASFKGFSGAGSTVFAGSPAKDDDDKADEFVPTAEFAPVVALPALVALRTGEEGEVALFEERAKLLRFDSDEKQWKERGVGRFRMLHDPASGKVRLLMRREQVLKVCCNHLLTSSMAFMPMKTTDKAYTWTAQDFSEGEIRAELLAIRFKTSDLAANFKAAIDRTQAAMVDDRLPLAPGQAPAPAAGAPPPLSELFKPATGSWECPGCYSRCEAGSTKCLACETTNPANPSQKSLFDMFKPATGSWECWGCYSRCDASKRRCPSCDTPKPSDQSMPMVSSSNFKTPGAQKLLFDMFKPPAGSWECKECYTRCAASEAKCPACETPNPADEKAPSAQKPLSELFKPAAGSWECGGCYTRCDAAKEKCPSCDTPNPAAGKAVVNQVTSSTGSTLTFMPSASTGSFNLPSKSGFSFGDSSAAKFTFGVPATAQTTNPGATFTFGSQPVDIPKPTTPPSTASKFTFGSPGKFEFNFSGVRPATSPGRPAASPGGDSDADHEEDEGDHIYFSPVIPLPDKVAVCTGEEAEDTVYCHRAKLYRFTAGEWKERGVGDFKILRHKETHRIRLLMRRDQILKVCLNHHLTPTLVFARKDDKTWMWSAADFSEGATQFEQFALRFKTPDIAATFKETLDQAQKELIVNGNASFSDDQDDRVSSSSVDGPAPSSAGGRHVASSRLGGDAPGKGVVRSLFGSPGSDDKSTPDKDELEVLFEASVTEEERAAALRLQLPANFYMYRHNPHRCPGCVGCEPSSDEEEPTKPPVMLFGQTTTASSVFGQGAAKPVFGATTTSRASALNTPLFGGTPTTAPLFGGTPTASIFGGTPTAPTTTPLFGGAPTAPTTTPLFGGTPTPSLFGGTPTASIFGGTPSAPTTTPLFGGTPTPSIFGGAPTTAPLFGGTTTTAPLFGATPTTASIFGGTATTTPLFGGTATIAPVFGAATTTTAPLFGGTVTSSVSTPLFGSSSTASFGQKDSTPLFGSSATTPIGQSANTPAAASAKAVDETPTNQENGASDIPFLPFDSNVSFADLASKNGSTPFQAAPGASFAWSGAGSTLFGTPTTPATPATPREGEEEEEEDTGADPDPHFEPIVPLPAAIELSTGEEGEQRLFCHRGKLYRYVAETKEWKERAVGEFKVLKGSGWFRLLMRREQIHKLVLNELITPDTLLKPMQTSDKAMCWASNNFADGEARLEELAVRFKTTETAAALRDVVEKCVAEIKEMRANAPSADAAADEEGDEDYEEVEDEEEEFEEVDLVLQEARAALQVRNGEGEPWQPLGAGAAQVVQAHNQGVDFIMVRIALDESEDDQPMFLSTIDRDTEMSVSDRSVEWRVCEYDESETEDIPRTFCLQFETQAAALEIFQCLEDGKKMSAAQQEEEDEEDEDEGE